MVTRTAIFVLGMHRSGTSALTRMLSLLGASLPRRLLLAGAGNELGHWEPEAAVALHDRLLTAAGTSTNGLDIPPESWFSTAAAEAFLEPMRALIGADFDDAPLFVLKDPRSALVFPLWRRVLAELGIDCRPVILSRNPLEAAASLVARQKTLEPEQSWTLDRAGLLWLRTMLAAEHHTRGAVRAFCTYSDLFGDWRSVAARLGQELSLVWPRPLAEAAPEIDSFLDARHRHQSADQVPTTRGGVWSSWIGPAFEALRHTGARREPDTAVLDAIARSFADVCAAIRPAPEPEATPVDASVAFVPDVAAEQRGLCLVVTTAMLDEDRDSALAAILDTATAARAALTILPAGPFPPAASATLAALAAGRCIVLQPCDGSMLPIEPAFMRMTVALFRRLRMHLFDAILFPHHGGLAHAAVIARQTGLAFAGTRLGVIVFGGARRQRERERRFPADLVTLSIEHIEQTAIEGADAVLLPDPAVAQWMRDAGWHVAPNADTAVGHDIRNAVIRLLRPEDELAAYPATAREGGDGITIVIPHFEQPHLLEQNLQALLQQTDRDFSVLVVDDGSQGAEAQHCLADVEERYCALSLKLLRQPNRYLGAARNAGIRAAETECIILLDDDNIAFPTMVATLRRAMRSTRADIVTCGIRHFHDATGQPDAAASGQGPDQLFAAGPVLVGAIQNCFGDASGIYRRTVFDRVGYFHELRGVTYEDWQLHLRAVAAGLRLVSLPEPLVWYRVRPDSMLRSTHPYDNARVIAATIQQMPCAGLDPLADFLIGQEAERTRLNRAVDAVRAVSAAQAAAMSDIGLDVTRHAHALERMLEVRTEDARRAERYARSLEETLEETRNARDTAIDYARSLEKARADAETYARHLEAELARITGAREAR
ncbi:glycosyltransferase [Methylovirgula sp. 4M-Z18]|uniref:glycosyltransferase n=1 Tax=Methylovirgula sp. 4M-Z18 TaxID=2293567 RepID=UPI000E2F9A94|nr:glycosyltransferase [Methylovirgula sp. 4M-Z18]RFB76495.1 glycosyltransferase [Methylovirgula sp. 4M-Z18]